ncbi:Putative neutral zinc metallopeptidase [Pirellulimonas nuda]|uniref:Neutral zinc metallopeptidase n=1 Tax=Pirellulimonas nuda TaxID=2528009 RepID=A0A518D6I3_9BACT|nr:zinc metallopeptidase [Pirellulimonas nuda]QDU87094.1 Putative neutral zinc metallopeptidase [Pirellulimonas nuda]
MIDPLYFIVLAPALLMAMWAQGRVRATYASASQEPAVLSGAATARHLLDSAGLSNVAIEPIAGQLTDHYDPRTKVLRLSQGVYGQHNMAAVGIAAHEAGHAIQDARGYFPLRIRNLAVPLAQFGGGAGMFILMAGLVMRSPVLLLVGIGSFVAVAAFQLINLPVEFDASRRAKKHLVEHGIISKAELSHVDRVLDAAAWTYVAGTLYAVLIVVYFLIRLRGGSRS